MKQTNRVWAILLLFPLLFGTGCASDETTLEQVREAYVQRGAGVDGYEVTEIAEAEGYSYFSVGILISEGDGLREDTMVFTEAHVFRFDSLADADAAKKRNEESGVGGTCVQKGKFLLLWNDNDGFDTFSDLYQEVFYQALGGEGS